MLHIRMIDLYEMAVDPDVDLDTRYICLKLMREKQRLEPRNYLKLWRNAAYLRKYRSRRVECRRWDYVKNGGGQQ